MTKVNQIRPVNTYINLTSFDVWKSILFIRRIVMSKLQAYWTTGKQSHSKFDTVSFGEMEVEDRGEKKVDRRSNKSKGNVTSVTSMRRSRQPRLTYRTWGKAGYHG